MFQIIVTIISIILFIAFLYAGTGYINVNKIFYIQDKSTILNALNQFSSGVSNYKLMNEVYPTSLGDIEPNIITTPSLPNYLAYDSFSFNNITGFVEVCFEADIENSDINDIFKNISSIGQDKSFIISENCGDTINSFNNVYPHQRKVTYFIR